MTQLIRDARLAEQVGLPGDTDDIEITRSDRNQLDTLASVCEAMAHKVVEPRLARALGVSPIDHEQAGELRDDLACLAWAIDHAAELNHVLAEALKLRAVAS